VLKEEMFYKKWDTWEARLTRDQALKMLKTHMADYQKFFQTPFEEMTEEQMKEVFDEGSANGIDIEDMGVNFFDLNVRVTSTTSQFECAIEDSYKSRIET